jgi:hypothetical protein
VLRAWVSRSCRQVSPKLASFPSILSDLPAAKILMYPPETVVAWKFEEMIRFGLANGRIKDFYDICSRL